MNIKYLFLCVVLAMTFVSCVQNEVLTENENTERKLYLSLSVSSITSRAPQLDLDGKGNFTDGDKILLCFSSDETVDYTGFKEYVVGNSEILWKELEIPSFVENVKVSGIYPLMENADNKHLVNIDAKNGSYDLLMATNMAQVNQWEPVSLVFRHVMHRIKVEYYSNNKSVSEEELGRAVTTITALTKATVDLKDAVLLNNSENNMSEYNSQTGKQTSFIVVPQENKDLKLKVKILEKEVEFTIPNELSGKKPYPRLKGGESITIRLNITRDDAGGGVKVSFTDMSINGWTDNGIVNGEVDL